MYTDCTNEPDMHRLNLHERACSTAGNTSYNCHYLVVQFVIDEEYNTPRVSRVVADCLDMREVSCAQAQSRSHHETNNQLRPETVRVVICVGQQMCVKSALVPKSVCASIKTVGCKC
jgi:hypothetical protein